MKEKKLALGLVILGIVIVAASLQFNNSEENVKLSVKRVVSGDEAVRMVKSIHLGNFEIKSAVVADFEGIGDIKVWIAYAENEDIAFQLAEKMKEKVHLYFSKPKPFEFDGLKTYRVFGNERTHYFFSFKDQVVWVEFQNPDVKYHERILVYLFSDGGMEKYIN